jgi:putative membrane-bound dehydrogenase-like protein
LTTIALMAANASAAGKYIPTTLPSTPPDPEIERASFKVTDGFEVNLWAADPQLAKPSQMNWDAQGRLWVTSSSMYPQIKPGETPADKVIVLEDTNNDGKADKATVFADGLLLPSAVAPGDGGAYVANSTELLHFKDTDGDGKSDQRQVVLSGFGTEDTHHILHTFRWGPDGRLYMNQSIYIHSHVETPWGVRRLMGSGIWRFRPENQQFEVVARGMVNPWGQAWDEYGQSFSTDGAGGEGIYHSFNGSAYQTAKEPVGTNDMERTLHGMNPGSPKYCGLEIVSGRALPDDWQGDAITNDFRANRVVRYKLIDEPNGAFVSKQMPDVITSKDVSFRPIDVKMGPDGAIYIADWFNPIINHGEVDFRDPRRDHTHGRIWRLTAKGRAPVKRPTLVGGSVESLFDQLKSPERWTRDQARQLLRQRGAKEVVPALSKWVNTLDQIAPRERLEALWVYQSLDTPEPKLLGDLLESKIPQVRAAAAHVVADWADHLPNAMELLAARVADEHSRVRLEAVRGLARLQTPRATELALGALDRPMDANVEFALWTSVRETKNVWLPAFRSGSLSFGGNLKHLIYAVRAVKSPEAVATLLTQLREGRVPKESQADVLDLVASVGGPEEAKAAYEFATAESTAPETASVTLSALASAARQRNVIPNGVDGSKLNRLLASSDKSLASAAIRLGSAWKLQTIKPTLTKWAEGAETDAALRRSAIGALAEWGPESAELMRKLDAADRPFAVREMAIVGLSSLDVKDAAKHAAALLAALPVDAQPRDLISAFLQRESGGDALAAALANQKLSPDTAKLALRAVNASGRTSAALAQRLREAAGLTGDAAARSLTPQEMASTIKEVLAKGNAERGELVFRRADSNCFQCHAIGGAGGNVAPDVRAIGASAPVDYLIDSILDPNKAIKDGYQSVVIATKKGDVFSGIKLSQDDKQIVLRDAQHDAIPIPRGEVRKERPGGSLMPAGLADTLTRGEFLDLVKFLSELGKPGAYQPDTALLVRRWRVLDPAKPAAPGTPVYSMVSGVLPIEGSGQVTVQGEIDVTAAGRIALRLNGTKALSMKVDGKSVELKSADVELDFAAGVHALSFMVDNSQRGGEGLRLEIRDLKGSSGHAQPVGGR